jgi:hypothetical protein
MVQQRIQPVHVGPTGTTSLSRGVQNAMNVLLLQITQPGSMPLLTLKGFLDITSIKVLGDPLKEWENLSHIIRKYNLPRYRSWGDLPRSVLSDHPDPRILKMVADVHATAKATAEMELAASHALNTLRPQAGYKAAEFVGGDTRYYRRG